MTGIRVVAFGDSLGIPQLIRHMPDGSLVAIVAAEIRPHSIEALQACAETQGIPLIVQPKRLSSRYPDFVATMKRLEPDFVIVNSYSMLLHADILAIPCQASVNVHAGLLPEYRGANPIPWAIINGETVTGVTMHYIDEGCDTGDIIAGRRMPIDFTDTRVEVQANLIKVTDELLGKEMLRLFAGMNDRIPQNGQNARHWPRRKPEDGLIDWHAPARTIYNLIRALVKPYPGAYFFDDSGRKIVIDTFLPFEKVKMMQKELIGYVIEQ